MRIHRPRIQTRLISPHLTQKRLARLNRPRPPRQQIQQAILGRRQHQLLLPYRRRHAAAVQFNAPRLHRSRFRDPLILLTSRHRPHSQKQLPRTKRLRHVIVRPHLQTPDLVLVRRLGRQHQNGNARGGRIPSQSPTHLHPTHLWHHQIQNHHRGKFRLCDRQPLRPIVCLQNIETPRLQMKPQHVPHILFILDD